MNRLLDLYSCAGGAGEGYRRAGFTVYSVDLYPQPHNPFPFYQGDVIAVLTSLILGEGIQFSNGETLFLEDFHTIHASPPCQAYSAAKSKNPKPRTDHPDLVDPTRDLLKATGKPWIIENVVGAPLIDPIRLCGTQFNLVADDVDGVPLRLLRHRLFESSQEIHAPEHLSHKHFPGLTASVFGSGGTYTPEFRDNPKRGGGYVPHIEVIKELMGIDWMNRYELSQSIPPAFTEYLGRQLLGGTES